MGARRRADRPKRGFGVPLRALVQGAADRLGARDPARSAHAPARLDAVARSRRAARAARARLARSRQAHLGAGLPGAVGAARTSIARTIAATARMRVTMLVRCLAMMRGGGETRHLAWARELAALGVDVDIITGAPLCSARRAIRSTTSTPTVLRSPYARDFVYRCQNRRGFGRLTMTALHLDEEWFCRAAWRRIAGDAIAGPTSSMRTRCTRRRGCDVGDIPVVINLPGAPNPRYTADLQQADALVADGWAAEHLPATLGRPVERCRRASMPSGSVPTGRPARRRSARGQARRDRGRAARPDQERAAAARRHGAGPRTASRTSHLVVVGEGPEAGALKRARGRAGHRRTRVTFAGYVPQHETPRVLPRRRRVRAVVRFRQLAERRARGDGLRPAGRRHRCRRRAGVRDRIASGGSVVPPEIAAALADALETYLVSADAGARGRREQPR